MASRWSRLAAILVVSVSLVLAAILPSAATTAAPASKVAAFVMDRTSGERTASFIVVLRSQADLSPSAALVGQRAKGAWAYRTLSDLANRTQAPIKAVLDRMGATYRSHFAVNALTVTGGRDVVTALAGRSDVASIVGNPRLRSTLLPAHPAVLAPQSGPATVEWNITKINAPKVWAAGDRGEGIVIGDIDTGEQWDHPALKGKYRGWNGTTADHNYNWYDATDPTQRAPLDPYGHGTHTLGTIVGDDGAGNQVGVAPGAQWTACRSMDDTGTGTPDSYITCFEFMIAPWDLDGQNPDPSKAPAAVSNSWYCSISLEGCTQNVLFQTVKAVKAAGIVPVVAAGNAGPSCSTIANDGPPAQYPQSLTVGATTSTDALAFFSSRGPVTLTGHTLVKPNISAPGDGVRSSYPPNTYAVLSGTSMATPHISGTIALILNAKPQLSGDVNGIIRLIEKSAHHINSSACSSNGTYPNNLFGYGIVDAAAASKP